MSVVAVVACGGRAQRVEGSESGSGGATGSEETGGGAGVDGDEVVLVLPVVPREEAGLPLILEEVGGALGVFQEFEVDVALGEPYPRTVTLRPEGGAIFLEDGRLLSAEEGLSFKGVSSESDAVGVRLVDEESFELTVSEEGRFSVWLEVGWVPESDDAPGAQVVSVEFSVDVRRVVSAFWGGCGDSVRRVVENAPLRTSYLRLYDEEVAWFSPVNADPASSVEVTVHAAPGTTLRADDGLGSLVAAGPEQTLSVRALGAEIGQVELVHLSSVDGLSARFFYGAPWQRGVTELSSGDSALVSRSAESTGYIGVAPRLSVGGVDVCSAELPEWFELRTESPETCPTNDTLGCGDACDLSALPVVALAENAGRCELTVTGAELNAGLGLSAELEVELVPLEPTGD